MSANRSEEPARVALITGAGRRVGAAIARALHADGWRVLIHCRGSREDADALAAELVAQRPDSADVLQADLADAGTLAGLAAAAHARWQRLDGLVNNASTYRATPLGKVTVTDFDDLVASNFKAPLLLTQACLPHFGAEAVVVNLLDTLARHARPGFAVYNAAKAALWSVTETLAVELAPRVRVNAIAPGHILWAEEQPIDAAQQERELSRVPLGRLGTPQEIARAAAFLMSPKSAYLTGVVLGVDGGLRLRGP